MFKKRVSFSAESFPAAVCRALTDDFQLDGGEFEAGRASRTAPMRAPAADDDSDGETTRSFRSVGEHTQVEKIGRIIDPSVIVDDELTVTQTKKGAGSEDEVSDDGDGETREGPMPLTLLNSLNPRIPGTIPGKTTQGFSLEDLEAVEASTSGDGDFDILINRIRALYRVSVELNDLRSALELNGRPPPATGGRPPLPQRLCRRPRGADGDDLAVVHGRHAPGRDVLPTAPPPPPAPCCCAASRRSSLQTRC